MSTRAGLERYYPGDEAWSRFVAAAPIGLMEFDRANELVIALCHDAEVAAAVYALLGSNSLEWVRGRKEMLGDLSPVECMSDEHLKRRLRTMLMRMPT